MARLPNPGMDNEQWGTLLNEFLQVSHNADGTAKNPPVCNVRDFGAAGDGTTDDAAAIQAAVTDAGSGGIVFFPKGKYVWGATAGVTIPASQTWLGSAESASSGGGGYSELSFPNLLPGSSGVSASNSFLIERMFLKGPGAGIAGCIGLSNGGSEFARVSARHAQFYDWSIGTQLTASYYSSFDHCEWRHNDIGLELKSVCYNVNIVAPRFDGINTFRLSSMAEEPARPGRTHPRPRSADQPPAHVAEITLNQGLNGTKDANYYFIKPAFSQLSATVNHPNNE